MTSNDLLRFCDSEVARYSRPWSRDGRTYACNNVVLIAVPALPDVPDNPAAPDAAQILSTTPRHVEYFPVPQVPPPETSPAPRKCTECDGTGRCECWHCGNMMACDECGGTGFVGKDPPVQRRTIGKQEFDEKYLYLIQDLPDVRICPATGMHPALIVFTGGEGLLMPMRRKAT